MASSSLTRSSRRRWRWSTRQSQGIILQEWWVFYKGIIYKIVCKLGSKHMAMTSVQMTE